jgi:hypothetical protein
MYKHKDSVIHIYIYIYELMEVFNFIYIRGARLLTNIPLQHFVAQKILAHVHEVLAQLLNSLSSH